MLQQAGSGAEPRPPSSFTSTIKCRYCAV